MTPLTPSSPNRRRDRSWLLLLVIVVLLGLLVLTPHLARQSWGAALKPLGYMVERVTCNIPQVVKGGFLCLDPEYVLVTTGSGCGMKVWPYSSPPPAGVPCLSGYTAASANSSGVGGPYVCWNDEACGDIPYIQMGYCNDPCYQPNSMCQDDLSCQYRPGDGYRCWDDTVCAGVESTGQCHETCGTGYPACSEGLSCVSFDAGANPVCYSNTLCEPPFQHPPLQITPQGITNPCTCGDGVCEQDRCNELIQNCPADCDPCAKDPCACNTCGDGNCRCNESPRSCPKDCQK